MSWFSDLFKKGPKNKKYAYTTNGWLPIYSQFGTNIYASDVVQQALKCIVDELKKLTPTHVRYKGSDYGPVNSTIQDVLNNPNPLMTTTDFIEKTAWLLLMNYNVFIIPVYRTWKDKKVDANGKVTEVERRYYEALYPIKPTQVDFIEDARGKLFVNFWFANGEQTTISYSDVIHIRHNYSVNEYMGGNEMGQPDHEALLSTLQLNHDLLQGIAKAMNASYAVNGVVKFNTLMDDGKTEAALRELEVKLANGQNGFLPLDLKAEFTPFEHKAELVNNDTLKFIDSKILRNWGIPLAILTGDYNKEQYEAFYQKALEPIIIALSQSFTKSLFTDREKAYGNKVEFYAKQLIFMSMSQKIDMVNLLSPTGALYENEKRAIFGLVPLPELEGKRYMSLNWINAADASQYQLSKANVDIVDEEKEED